MPCGVAHLINKHRARSRQFHSTNRHLVMHWVYNADCADHQGTQYPIPARFTPCAVPPRIQYINLLCCLCWFPHRTTMSGCTLQLSRDSALRTVLVDRATGYAEYQIDTPIKIARSVTWIRKLHPSTHPLHRRDGDTKSGSNDDITDMGKRKKQSKTEKHEGRELRETGDEIARIHWSCFSPDRFVFRGTTTTRSEFLPKAGKMKG
jgi:hypothetical protein